MSNVVNPIAGNDRFSKIENAASHLNELNLTSGQVVDLSAGTVTTQLLNQAIAGSGTLWQVVGYAPSAFATAAAGDVLFLNNQQQSAVASAVTDSHLLLLPAGAQVVSAVVTNNGVPVVGGVTFDIGTEVWSSAGSGNSDISAAMLLATVNSGGKVGDLLAAPVSALGTSGVAFASGSAVAANTGVTVQVLGAPNTAGDLAVTITYLL